MGSKEIRQVVFAASRWGTSRPPDPLRDIFGQMKGSEGGHFLDERRVVLVDQRGVGGEFIGREMVFFRQKVDGAQDRARFSEDRDVDAGTQAERRDQGVVKEVFGEFGRGVGDEGFAGCDALVVPAVAGNGFGARHRVFLWHRRIGATGEASGFVLHGHGEQTCAKGGAGGVKIGAGLGHGILGLLVRQGPDQGSDKVGSGEDADEGAVSLYGQDGLAGFGKC